MMGYLMAGLIMMAASSVALIEIALGPDQGRFPCVSKKLIWAARLLAGVFASRAFFVARAEYNGVLPPPSVDQLLAAMVLAGFLLLLLVQIIKLRLAEGLWRRLFARIERTRRLARDQSKGLVLAKLAADGVLVAAPMEGPDVILDAVDQLRSAP